MSVTSGLLDWLGRGAASLAGVAQNRLELATIELEEERQHISSLLLVAALALIFIGLGLVLASLLLVVIFWDDHRVAVLSALTLLYLGTGGLLVLRWRAQARAKPPLLGHTMDELRKDIAALRGDEGAPAP